MSGNKATGPRSPTPRSAELADGRRLTLRDWPGTGPTVVLLHGLLDSSRGWDSLARALPNRCLAIDLPGFGDSDLPTRPRLSAYADDVLQALDRVGCNEFVLVGHSLGGGVAAAIADRAPERVISLLLIAPAGFGRIGMAEAVSIPGLRDVVARGLPFALSNPVVLTMAYMTVISNRRVPDADLLNRTMRRSFDAVPGAREATKAVVAAGLSKRGFATRRLAYPGPVRLIWGDRDRIVPIAHSAAVLRALPQTVLAVWPGMGHHPQSERPRELLEVVAGVAQPARPGLADKAA